MERLVVALLLHLFGVLQRGTQQLVIDDGSLQNGRIVAIDLGFTNDELTIEGRLEPVTL